MSNTYIIFTDGGANGSDYTSGHYAFIITKLHEKEEGEYIIEEQESFRSNLLFDVTVPRLELTAVLHGLEHLTKNYKDIATIVVITDAINTVHTYNKWIWSWDITKGENDSYKLTKNYGKEVKNSDVILSTHFLLGSLINEQNITINILHLNSHIPVRKKQEYYRKFIERNVVDIPYDLFEVFVDFNSKVDGLVGAGK